MPKGRQAIDYSNQKINMLTVLYRDGTHKSGCATWKCLCDCGQECSKTSWMLKCGVMSCGCYAKALKTTHGMHGTKEYRTWDGMKARCLNPKHQSYHRYGGRGIRVCERWMTFENFYEDMGDAPDGFTLDRIDNDGNYCPENCRWADWDTQYSNRRNSVRVEFRGELKTIGEWCRLLNLSYERTYHRIQRTKLPVDYVLSGQYDRDKAVREQEMRK